MNRIDRLHAILTQLQSKRLVKAQEIADRFNISLRTVYRDVKALEESGVPVLGEAGSGYSIMEGYRLPPLMFTQEEAASLLLAGKLAAPHTDASVQKQLEEALLKIKSVLRTADKDQLNELSKRIQILSSSTNDEPSQKHLLALQQAVATSRLLFIHYESSYNKTETTQRLVEPLGLLHYSNAWHLIGWCRLRKDYRDFKVNRITRLQVKEETVDVSKHKSLTEYISSLAQNYELTEMVILVDKDIVKYMESSRRYYGFVREELCNNKVRMFFLVTHPEPFARWLLMFTNSITVESPAMLRMFLEALTEELKEHYLKS